MELSKPAIVTPPQNLMTARSVDDPFFANANHQLSDKGFLVASANNLIANWSRFVMVMLGVPGEPMLTLVPAEELEERRGGTRCEVDTRRSDSWTLTLS